MRQVGVVMGFNVVLVSDYHEFSGGRTQESKNFGNEVMGDDANLGDE
jgi:hypothetical protein